jgi:hypothetical protein
MLALLVLVRQWGLLPFAGLLLLADAVVLTKLTRLALSGEGSETYLLPRPPWRKGEAG